MVLNIPWFFSRLGDERDFLLRLNQTYSASIANDVLFAVPPGLSSASVSHWHCPCRWLQALPVWFMILCLFKEKDCSLIV